MALELRQQLKLSQQLVMTPQLQQAIKLLQLSRLELVESIQQELMENPLLEEVLEEEKPERVMVEEEHGPLPGGEDTAIEKELLKSAEWDDYLGDFASTPVQSHIRETEIPEEGMAFDARLSSKPSLEGHLDWQMRLSNFTARELAIGEAICGSLDSSGYLAATAEELAGMTGTTIEEVEAVLYRVQRLDPVGVAARNPRECLLVQMEVLEYTDPILLELVSEHLEDLEKKRYKPLVKKFRISMEQLKAYLDTIQSLDPLPGASFGSSDPIYVSPDAYIYKYENDFIILLNEEGLPRLQLNALYMEGFKPKGDKERDYIQDKKRSAEWLMKSLYQRQRTLYKVLESIVRFQRGFFDDGVNKLRPLILKDVADDINMHESTVSRITSNKYVATPHGIFELKFFFNSSLELDDGSTVGSESVKATIRQLIASEDPKKPVSDEAIADILKETLQINIARRTVAKYRTAMDIASSSKRKEVF
ncbi:RNA polymerase factor sigma-54 [Desulfolutivibrio sulfoxidireducens]|uniref:RNA polymerase factor sigma-54 n=1 Tax=Desulfolutivibrio sulfoxidireducens TaxID=2773299 RepID=UPI00159D5AB4|nr:RNA polymerase factor sigma-54 [Desulfolutivibrio sulfoxidireducens]QLA16234.1 RNA polymerase factor sigma-54 [Desulfolutivibrio sulfoxidireducens]QLA19867.1 RNA polymerase factor sigma-54 [Desulfolutivibrio sulfoxidireducens]